MCQKTNSFIDWLQIQALVMCSIGVFITKVFYDENVRDLLGTQTLHHQVVHEQ